MVLGAAAPTFFAADAAAQPIAPSASSPPSLPDVIERTMASLCKVQGMVDGREIGGGSGFVLDSAGTIATNAHVFASLASVGTQELRATFDDGRVFLVEPLAADAESDLAIGRLVSPPGTSFTPLPLGRSGALRRGDPVVAAASSRPSACSRARASSRTTRPWRTCSTAAATGRWCRSTRP